MTEQEDIFSTRRVYEDGVIERASNARIGRYIFFPKEIEDHYGSELPNKLFILDIGCGGCADHPLLMDYFKKKGVELTLFGIDVNRELLQLTKAGSVTYPLELDMEVDEEGRLSFDRHFGSYKRSDRAAFPNSLLDYFVKWDSQKKLM